MVTKTIAVDEIPLRQGCRVKLKEAWKRILSKFKKLAEEKSKGVQKQDIRVVGPQKSNVSHVPRQRKKKSRKEARCNAAETGRVLLEAPRDIATRTLLVTLARAVFMWSGRRGQTAATEGSLGGEKWVVNIRRFDQKGEKKLGRGVPLSSLSSLL